MRTNDLAVSLHTSEVIRVVILCDVGTVQPALELHEWVIPDQDDGGLDIMYVSCNGDCKVLVMTETAAEALLTALTFRRMKREGKLPPGTPVCEVCGPTDFPYDHNIEPVQEDSICGHGCGYGYGDVAVPLPEAAQTAYAAGSSLPLEKKWDVE